MHHTHRPSILLSLVLPLIFSGCQPVATPSLTVTPSPTETLIPTAALTPSLTLELTPTATPKPLCGTPFPASRIATQTNTAGSITRFEPPDGQAYFGFTYRLWEADA